MTMMMVMMFGVKGDDERERDKSTGERKKIGWMDGKEIDRRRVDTQVERGIMMMENVMNANDSLHD